MYITELHEHDDDLVDDADEVLYDEYIDYI